jgi:hypothetical protein
LTSPPRSRNSRAFEFNTFQLRRDAHETHIPAKPPEARPYTRFPLSHGNQEWP